MHRPPRKRLLIAMDTLAFGGIEKAAIALLKALSPDDYEVTLLLMRRTGELLGSVPKWVPVEEVPLSAWRRTEWEYGRKVVLRRAWRSFRWGHGADVIVRDLRRRLSQTEAGQRLVRYDLLLPAGTVMPGEYDCAIAYANVEQLFLVAERIRARQKIAWLHTEVSSEGFDMRPYRRLLARCDYVFGVSAAICASFSREVPELAERTMVAYYNVDNDGIRRLASQAQAFDDDFKGLRLLSVGRVARQKGFDIALEVAGRLCAEGLPVRWYVIGDGIEREGLERQVADRGLSEVFRFLGAMANPYPFFAACDIYVQPSRYEGYCLTVHEARVFAKPILCTDFAGAREQLVDEETGLIVPCEVEAIFNGVRRLILDAPLRELLSRNLAARPLNQGDCVQRLREVLAEQR